MRDLTEEFFERLRQRGHERLLGEAKGTIRFSLERDHQMEHWFVAIKNGDVEVSRAERPADCVIRTKRSLFDRITTGEANLQQAWLRNEVLVEGDLLIIRRFDRIFPGPPGAHHPRTVAHARLPRP